MLSHRGENGKAVWEEWHRFRSFARRNAFSENEFSEIEQNRFDLDTARITGADNPKTFRTEPPLDPEVPGVAKSRDIRLDRDEVREY